MAQPPLIPPHVDYTGKDWAAIYARLRNLIRSVFPRWTEEAIADFGNMLVGMFADVGDVLMYYVDMWARESRIVTAQMRRSLVALARLVGYTPYGPQAAQATEDFVLSQAAAAAVTLPAGTVVKTAAIVEPTRYQLLEDLIFAIGETTKSATVENSEFAADQFTSAETPDLSLQLSRTPFLQETELVTAANGVYSRVDDLLLSSSTDRHYTLTVDAEERASLTFGNGVKGAIPLGQIDVDYKIGGGQAGEVEAESLSVLEGTPYTDALGNPVIISVVNPERSTAGSNRESNRSIKTFAPLSVRVQERAVTKEDFEIVARSEVAGVGRALMLFRDDDPGVPENAGYLYIVPDDGGQAPQLLLDEVRSHFEQVVGFPAPSHPKGNTLNLEVRQAPYQAVDPASTVYFRQGVSPALGRDAVLAVLQRFFAIRIEASQLIADAPDVAAAFGITEADGDTLVDNPRVDFGLEFRDIDGNPTRLLPWSDVFNAIRDVAEVAKIDAGANGLLLAGERQDLSIETFAFPILGSAQLINGDTGQPL